MKKSMWIRVGILSGALMATFGATISENPLSSSTNSAFAAPAPARVNGAFVHLLPVLRRAGIPLLLPTRFPIARAYADLGSVGPGRYVINLGYTPGCNGHACELGHLAAKKDPTPLRAPHGKALRLLHGFVGYFVNYTCGANCGDAFLRVDYLGYRYTFALKAGSPKELRALVNSAIAAGPA
ncbi:MAG: hypothetical protein NVSMB52_00160 [Chloroflexota bacterium]